PGGRGSLGIRHRLGREAGRDGAGTCRAVRRRPRGGARRAHARPAGRRGPGEGLARRGPGTGRPRAPRAQRSERRSRRRGGGVLVTAILLAAAVGFFVSLLGSPIAIRAFRLWGWGQRIREDGPRGPLEQMGTPTMGGIVILVGAAGGYAVARVVTTHATAAGLLVLGVALALGALGATDDLVKILRRRSLGLSIGAKLAGQAIIGVVFAYLALHVAHVNPDMSFVRDTGLRLGWFFYVWVFLMIAASANAVNLTDGLDGLASGSSALVLAAYVVIAFWEFRHSCELPLSRRFCYDLGVAQTL